MPQNNQFQSQTLKLFCLMENSHGKKKHSLRERIILLNIGLAHTLAQSYNNRCSVPFEDLLQIAKLGLCLAVDSYNPEKGTFSCHAAQSMRSEMMHYNRDKALIIRGPRQERDRVKLIDNVWRINHANGVPALSKFEIAYLEFGWDSSQYQKAVNSTKKGNVSSLDCGESSIDIPTVASPEALAIKHENTDQQLSAIASLLSRLPDLAKRFVQHHYMDQMSYVEIALMYGKSKREVQSQVEASMKSMGEGL